MARFMVDECTGRSVVRYLRENGFDAVGVTEVMPQATDSDILRRAFDEDRVVITNDKDFGDMVYRDRRKHCGIILLRLSDDRASQKIRVLAAVLSEHIDKIGHHFVVVTETSIRIRSTEP